MFRLVRVLCLSLTCGLVLSAAPTFKGNEKANCGGVYKDKAGAIESPGWPQNYPARLHCVYEIGVLPGRKITLQFAAFHLRPRVGRRCLDRLRVYDGDDLIGGRVFCGREISPTRSFTSKTSKVTVVFTTHRRSPLRGFRGFRATYSSAYFECGVPVFPRRPRSRSTETKIAGGNVAAPGSYPWQVSLRLGGKDGKDHACGGALLNENWVVTAAICVRNAETHSTWVVFGEHNMNNSPEWKETVKVQKIIVHPQYDPWTHESDIALLKVKSPVSLNDYVLPICLPEPKFEFDLPGTNVTITGWGKTSKDGEPSSFLRQADVPVTTICPHWWDDFTDMMQVCTGYGYPEGGPGPCIGDAGGPVVVFASEEPAYLLGIVSGYGFPCGHWYPSVSIRVSSVIEWIHNIMDENP
ncbi:chymotrypsinogen A-like [Branchiostoma lanceolatum]|uniref:chymotrypsinogen A-like n=1 Tax=Branchiostoma lanceolatum TaxID=7740 RepID=UPI0034517CA3